MVDDHLIERFSGSAALHLHRPVAREIVFPNESDPVVQEDGNGLRAGHAYMTVFHDEGVYRMYYGVSRFFFEKDRHTRVFYYAESRDGIEWETPNLGLFEFEGSRDNNIVWWWDEAFIPPGLRPRDNWIYGDNYANWGMVTTASHIEGAPEELTFYLSEGSRRDHYSKVYRRYTLRVDGFASVRASRHGGEVFTHPLIFSGSELVLNFSASAAGSICVELQDMQGVAIPGFALADCVEVLGDDLERSVRWRDGADLGQLAGSPVRLRFRLTDADLFSLRFK
jgi:hypothetical protein